jgi:hypothetical protein
MDKKLQNCANCGYGHQTDGNKLWCGKDTGKAVYFNGVCSFWKWDEIPYLDRLEEDSNA